MDLKSMVQKPKYDRQLLYRSSVSDFRGSVDRMAEIAHNIVFNHMKIRILWFYFGIFLQEPRMYKLNTGFR